MTKLSSIQQDPRVDFHMLWHRIQATARQDGGSYQGSCCTYTRCNRRKRSSPVNVRTCLMGSTQLPVFQYIFLRTDRSAYGTVTPFQGTWENPGACTGSWNALVDRFDGMTKNLVRSAINYSKRLWCPPKAPPPYSQRTWITSFCYWRTWGINSQMGVTNNV